jgi:hypothetical protein
MTLFSTSTPPEKLYINNRGILTLSIYFLLLGFIIASNLIDIWPGYGPIPEEGKNSIALHVESDTTITMIGDTTRQIEIVTVEKEMTPDSLVSQDYQFSVFGLGITKPKPLNNHGRLLLIVLFMGALGSWLHATSSFVAYVGNRSFITSWMAWYIVRPLIGSFLALIFYMVLKVGLITTSGAPINDISPYSIAAAAGLVGLFTERATKKLAEVFDAIFVPAAKDKDALEHKAASITGPEDHKITVNSANPVVTLAGENFLSNATVLVNGKERTFNHVSDKQIILSLDAEDVSEPGTLSIMIKNPAPGNEESNTLKVEVVAGEPADPPIPADPPVDPANPPAQDNANG